MQELTKKPRNQIRKDNPRDEIIPPRLLASNDSRFIGETGTAGYLTQQETMLPALIFSSCSLKAQLAG